MNKYFCETCQDSGYVFVRNGPDDSEKVACPDCPKGLEIMEQEAEPMDMSGAGEGEER